MHLHSATTVDGRDRNRLERVCRYLLRPPFAHDAVEETSAKCSEDDECRVSIWGSMDSMDTIHIAHL